MNENKSEIEYCKYQNTNNDNYFNLNKKYLSTI